MIILASASPRRKEILSKFGYEFAIEKSKFTEQDYVCSDAISVVLNNAKGKAYEVFSRFQSYKKMADIIVLGADTVVFSDGAILGKPKTKEDSIAALQSLSGKTHQVFTGFCLIGEKTRVFGVEESSVSFNKLTDNMIKEYVDKFKPFDKAGSYGVQDEFPLVKSVKGSIYNVIGLPIEKIKPSLDFFCL